MSFLSDLGISGTDLFSTGAGLLGSYLQGQQATSANQQTAAQMQTAAQQAKFKPFGITSSFGQSGFQYDPSGNLVGAGYSLAPGVQDRMNTLFGASGGMLDQTMASQQATAPMGASAQQMMGLGQQYLASSPQEQAQKWMTDQQGLLAGSRASQLAGVKAGLNATGRTGFSIGGEAGLGASNPELQAYYNAIAQQDKDLASQATQKGMDYANFGSAMVGAGGDMLKGMYGTQTASYAPYNAAISGASALEQLGRGAFDLSTTLGGQQSSANVGTGNLAAQAAAYSNAANSYSPFAGMLSGMGRTATNWGR